MSVFLGAITAGTVTNSSAVVATHSSQNNYQREGSPVEFIFLHWSPSGASALNDSPTISISASGTGKVFSTPLVSAKSLINFTMGAAVAVTLDLPDSFSAAIPSRVRAHFDNLNRSHIVGFVARNAHSFAIEWERGDLTKNEVSPSKYYDPKNEHQSHFIWLLTKCPTANDPPTFENCYNNKQFSHSSVAASPLRSLLYNAGETYLVGSENFRDNFGLQPRVFDFTASEWIACKVTVFDSTYKTVDASSGGEVFDLAAERQKHLERMAEEPDEQEEEKRRAKQAEDEAALQVELQRAIDEAAEESRLANEGRNELLKRIADEDANFKAERAEQERLELEEFNRQVAEKRAAEQQLLDEMAALRERRAADERERRRQRAANMIPKEKLLAILRRR